MKEIKEMLAKRDYNDMLQIDKKQKSQRAYAGFG
jgi:hypothetical protein